eukprot:SAG31_NODE_2741_length_5156_cov_3.138817_8_plen_55_part_00
MEDKSTVMLPRAAVQKIAKEILPPSISLSKDSCDVLLKCCTGVPNHSVALVSAS